MAGLGQEVCSMAVRTDGAQLAWTIDGIEHALEVYCAEVEAADLAIDTKKTYTRHARYVR
jgi:hypothetical protein